MATKLKLGTDNNWATKEGKLLGYNDENNYFKPIPFDVTSDADATRINKDGLVERTKTNVPRISFNGADNPHLLLEPERTNQFTNSENLANIDYQTNSTVTTENIIAPNGSLTADKTTQTSAGYLRETVSVSNGTTYTFSVFLKKGDLRYAVIRSLFSQNGVTPANSNNVFDLDNGSVIYTGTNIVSASIEAYTNDWYRCSFVSLASSSGSAPFIDFYFSSSSSSTQSSGTSGFGYGWGMQLEAGTYASSYIPNATTGVVTRTADSCTGGGVSDTFSDTEGTVFIDLKPFTHIGDPRISLSDGGNNKITFSFVNSTQVRMLVFNGSLQAEKFQNITYGDRIKLAITYKNNEFKFVFNGSVVSTDPSGSVPTGFDRFNFTNSTGSQNFQGEIYQTMVFNEALTDSELQTLTS